METKEIKIAKLIEKHKNNIEDHQNHLAFIINTPLSYFLERLS